MAPWVAWVFLWKKQETLGDKETEERFGSLFSDLKIKSKAALLFNVVFMLRRLAFALLGTLLDGYPFLQLQLFTLHCLSVSLYLTLFRPFSTP